MSPGSPRRPYWLGQPELFVIILSCPGNQYGRGTRLPAKEFFSLTQYEKNTLECGWWPHGMTILHQGRRYMVVGNGSVPEDAPEEAYDPQALLDLGPVVGGEA